MRGKTLCSVMLALAGLATSATAQAQDPPAAPEGTTPPPAETAPPAATTAASGGAASDSKMRVALNLVPMPVGSFAVGSASTDAAVAFGVMPVFDYLINPNFFVGVGPNFAFNVKGKDASGDSAKQYDLLVRVGGGVPVGEKLQVFGYLAPGYSIISPPTGDSAKGLTVGAHAGAIFDISPTMFANGTLGYQYGMQKFMDTDLATRFFQVALGVGMRL